MKKKQSPSSSVNGHLQSSNNTTSGCFTRIFSCFLCGSPSNRRKQTKVADSASPCRSSPKIEYNGDEKGEERIIRAPSPSIVARLMGLETMPEDFDSVPPALKPDSFGRSRSTNSLNWQEFDPLQRQHRKVKTSLSFREIPTFLREENEKFLLLSFGSDEQDELVTMQLKGLKSVEKKADKRKVTVKDDTKQVKPEKRNKDQERNCPKKNVMERRINERRSRRPNYSSESNGASAPHKREISRKSLQILKADKVSKLISCTGTSAGPRFPKKKEEAFCADQKVESECSSENLSPVSVLDCTLDSDTDFYVDSDTLTSEGDSSPSLLNLRRKVLSHTVNSSYLSSPVHDMSTSSDGKLEAIREECRVSIKKNYQPLDYSELWGVIWRLTEEDVKKSNWVEAWKVEEAEEIGIEFGLQFLEQLLHEAVAEFSE